MSTTIDERVVEMRFDNQHFERNVSTTMSTLDKLKEKLNLSGAAKGLDNISNAAGKVNMSGLSSGIENVSSRFSALEVIGITALANITNSAVNAGKRIVSALTIDPIKTGFQEYETQINAVQTILANTKSKGSTIEDVNKALDELNKYADLTIYNFTEMTRNIGTFTAAGIDLETSVNAIQGIANLAAVSGSTSQQASTAMYQLSQALASGTVKLMDWNSVVNAGMGGEMFQNALKETSELLGTGAEAAIEANGSFRESLRTGWLTSEVLTETLKKFTTSGANERVAEYTGLSKEAVAAALEEAEARYGEAEAIEYASKALAEKSGKNADEIKSVLEFAKTAEDAATKVKTFTQLWDVLKEAAQSGWSQTWRLIIGDFEEAKNLLTPLADFFTGIISSMSDARNQLLESALGRGFSDMFDGLNEVLGKTKDGIDSVLEPVKATSEALEDLGVIVDKVILGSFGNGEDRFKALTEAGYNYYRVQNKVNETLGNSFRHSEELIAEQDKLLGKQTETTEQTEEQVDATNELTDANKKQLLSLTQMTDAQLRSAGYTEKQISAIRELTIQAEKLGIPINEFIENLDQINGRWLLINSFKNVGKALVDIGNAIRDAWKDVFPITLEEKAEKLFNVIAALHKFTANLKNSVSNNIDEITRTFKGLFAALDILLTVIGGPLKIAFKAATQLLGMFDLNVLDITAAIGDAVVEFRDFIDSALDFEKIFENLVDPIKNAATSLREWIDSLKDSENLPEDIAKGIVSGIGKAINFVRTKLEQLRDMFENGFSGITVGNIDFGGIISGLKNVVKIAGQVVIELGKIALEKINSVLTAHGFEEISTDVITGFINGIRNGISKVGQAMIEFGKAIINKICDILGIHSPSTVFYAIGGFIIAGLVGGLLAGSSEVLETIKGIGESIAEFFSGLDFGNILAAGISAGTLVVLFKMSKALSVLADPLEGLGDVFSGVGSVLKSTSKVVKKFASVLGSISMSIKAKALKDIALALLMLVGAIAVLTFLDTKKVWASIGAIAALAAVLGVLFVVMNKAGGSSDPKDMVKGVANVAKLSTLLLAFSASLLIIAATLKILETIDPENAKMAFGGLAAMVLAIVAVLAAYGQLVKGKTATNIAKVGTTLLLMSVSLLLMAMVVKQLGGLDRETLIKGSAAIATFGVVMVGLVALTKLAGNKIGKVGTTLVSMAMAMLLMAAVVKIMGTMDEKTMLKGGAAILAFSGIMVGLVAATKLVGVNDMTKLGSTLIGMGAAMLMMAIVVRLLGDMDLESLAKGGVAILAFSGIMVGLVAATKLVGERDLKRVGSTLLMMSVSIGILAVVATLLGLMDVAALAKGIVAVGALAGIMSMMVYATKYAKDCKGNLIVMTIAIATMAASVAALSMIDGSKLAGAVIAIGSLMGIFAVLVKVAGTAKGSLGTLITMTVAIGLLGGVLYLLSGLPVESTIGSATALSILLLAMAGVMTVLSLIAPSVGTALVGALGLTAMAVPLLAFVGVLSLMQDVQNATTNASVLVKLVAVLTIALMGLTVVGSFAASAIFGVTSLLLMAVPMVAFVGILALMEGLQNATANVEILTNLMLGLTAMLVVLAIVGPMAMTGVGAMAALIGLITAVGLLAVGVGALMEKFPQLEEFLNKGIPLLEQIAYAIGSFVGNIAAGFVETVAGTLPVLGTALSDFMINATPFIEGIKMVDSSMLEGIGVLSAAIVALSAADLASGAMNFLHGGSTLGPLGTELSTFITNAMPFIQNASMLTEDTVAGVKALSDIILTLTKANIAEGLTSWFTGGSSLSAFGEQLVPFGESIAAFSQKVIGLDEGAVAAAANAGKIMAEMASTLPNSGGVVGFFAGENDISTFGTQLVSFGESIAAFSQKVTGTINEEAVTAAANAGKTMLALAETLPNTGGVVAFFAGDNDLSTFGTQLVSFGESIVEFSNTVSGINEEAVRAAANAGSIMATLAKSLPSSGGFASVFTKDNDMSTFGKELKKFGESLKDFSDEVTGIDTGAMSTAISQCNRLVAMAKNMSGVDFGNLSSFGDALGDVGKTGVDSFIKAFKDAESKVIKAVNGMIKSATDAIDDRASEFKDAGSKAASKFADGIESDAKKAKKNAKTMASDAATAIEDKYDDFYDAGECFVKGFAAGISDNTYRAEAKAAAMAKAAVSAAKEELLIKSPSKVTYGIGEYFGLGFVNAINDYSYKSVKAGAGIAESAKSGLSDAISKIRSFIDSDIDPQPTISPVLDLSDVESGVDAIRNMFGADSRVGVLANVGAINTMMARRNQNGVNDDVVSAIKDLSKDLSNVGGDSYSVNGITYNDGSELKEAIETIIRIAKIERRS